MSAQLHGAARRSFVRRLDEDLGLVGTDEWDARHERIARWHIDTGGHRVCGCEIHQAYCSVCHADMIAEYEQENRERGNA